MTEGKPLPLILQFALPLLLGNLLQQTYNIADAAIVGNILGTDGLAAVSASSSVQFLVIGFCIGICSGFAIPVAQRFGANDHVNMREYIFNAEFLTAIFAVVITVICAILCPTILHLLKTPDNIYDDAYRYLFVIFMGIPFTLLYNILSSVLRAVGDSRTPFIFLVISTVLNIGMDFLFIAIFELGCMGAGLATIIAQGVSGIICFIYIRCKIPVLRFDKNEKRLNGHIMGRLMIMGVPMGLQYSITAIGSMVMQSANNGLGDIYISGFAAAARIKQLSMSPFDALATGVSTFASQNLGAAKLRRINQGIRIGYVVGVAYGIAIGLVVIFFGRNMTMLFVSGEKSEAVLDASSKYLAALGKFFWVIGLLNTTRMTTQGIGYSMRAILSGVFEMVARISVSLIFVPIYGYTAICYTDQSAWISACLYIIPTMFWCLNREYKKHDARNRIDAA